MDDLNYNPIEATDDYIAYVYDAGGRVLEKWYPNGVNSQYEWNADGTLAKLRNRINYDDYSVVSRHEYAYTGLGQRQSLLEKVGSLAQPAQNEAYAYDAWDNRIRQTRNGQTQYAVLDAAQQLLELRQGAEAGPLAAAFVYDANGNLTKKCEGGTVTRSATDCTGATVTQLTWSPLDELIQVQKTGLPTERYAYDHAGRRIAKTVNGVTTNYLYDGEDIHAEYGNWASAQALYTHGPETDDPLIRFTASQTRYYHRDGLGSVVAITDGTGGIVGLRQYDAWGNVLNQTGSIDQYGYTGREPDATGLMYYRARYYDPAIGRFVSRDPAGMPDGVNRYAYVGNDPIDYTDPEGLVAQLAQPASYHAGTNSGVIPAGGQNLRNVTTQEEGSGVKDFLLGFIPGYDLYQATQNKNAGALDYFVGVLGILPGAGKGAGLGIKYGSKALEGVAKSVAPAKRASNQTVLGSYPDYVKLSDEVGARRFQIPPPLGQNSCRLDRIRNPGAMTGR